MKHVNAKVRLGVCAKPISKSYSKGTERHGDRHLGTFCAGVADILTGVDELHSLLKATKRMGMAYSNAWLRLRGVEESFGITLTSRDGARGSILTPEGRHLLTVYRQLQTEATETANKRLRELLR
jgi:molybdate transport system regulatory protein